MSSSSSKSLDMETLLSTIQVMRKREMKYRVSNYISRYSSSDGFDLECRRKMCQWSYQIIDHCNFQRETVAVAMNMLDRFVDARSLSSVSNMTRSTYQLAAMTSLYTAIKLFEPQAITPKTLAALSSGAYTKEHIEAVEVETLLPGLQWLLHPPTAISFGKHYIELFLQLVQVLSKALNVMEIHNGNNNGPISLDRTRDTLLELVQVQLDASIFDYELIQIDPSVVAYAALLNSLESLPSLSTEEQQKLDYYLHKEIFCAPPTELKNQLIQSLRLRLYQIISVTDVTNDKQTCTSQSSFNRLYPGTTTVGSPGPTKMNARVSPRTVCIPSSS